jgi:signal transduction histidine kinase
MKKLFYKTWKWALLVACLLVCSFISILPQWLFPIGGLDITSLSESPSQWRLHIEDPDISPVSPESQSTDWKPLEEQLQFMDNNHYRGAYWLQTTLPVTTLHSPYLWIKEEGDFELFLDQAPLYTFRKSEISHSLPLFFNVHIVPLTTDSFGQTLYIRSSTDGNKRILDTIQLGSGVHFNQLMLIKDMVKLLLAAWFVALGLISSSLYLLKHKEKTYIYFSLFSFTLAFACFTRSYLPHTFLNLSWYMAFKNITLPISILAILGFQEALGGSMKFKRLLRRTRRTVLIFILICLTAACIDASYYEWLMEKVLPALYIALTFLGIREILRYKFSKTRNGRKEIEILIFGFNILGTFTLLHIMVTLNSPASAALMSLFPLLFAYWSYDQIFVACFLFDLCLGVILLLRFTETYRQAKAYASQLESKNQELKTLSHLHYQMSIQETFEAMGEVAIWEERNRIAHEIHDILGHNLTATLVQLEAAKRLMAVSPEIALQKLELAQEAVRRGLHDIREAVHTVKNDLKRADLFASLVELIQETEKMSGITIEFEIGLLPMLNALQKKVLYHALQEGLTNGIKHGGSKKFVFQLHQASGQLHFLLINYGKPYQYDSPGYGLTAMADKVRHLGGTSSLRALRDEGSMLQITIPLQPV